MRGKRRTAMVAGVLGSFFGFFLLMLVLQTVGRLPPEVELFGKLTSAVRDRAWLTRWCS